jgi:hypothetical protein
MRERKSGVGGQDTATLQRMTLLELVSSSSNAILRLAHPVIDDLDGHGARHGRVGAQNPLDGEHGAIAVGEQHGE